MGEEYPDDQGGNWGDPDFGWGYDDWGTSSSGWSSWTDYSVSSNITYNENGNPQVVEITATRMTLWEKISAYADDVISEVGHAIDSALATMSDRGYVTIGAQNWVGFSLTADFQGNLYVGITAGPAGLSLGAGLTPEGVPTTTYLAGLGATVAVPVGTGVQLGIGDSAALGGTNAPYIGLSGAGVGYTVNITEPVAGHSDEQFLD